MMRMNNYASRTTIVVCAAGCLENCVTQVDYLQVPSNAPRALLHTFSVPPVQQSLSSLHCAPVTLLHTHGADVRDATRLLEQHWVGVVLAEPTAKQAAASVTHSAPSNLSPFKHWTPHRPAAQVGLPYLAGPRQALSHAPQLFTSLFRSVQVSVHFVGVALGHSEKHWFPTGPASAPASAPAGGLPQSSVGALHTLPHLPQFLAVVISASQPLTVKRSQSPLPGRQVLTLQVFAWH
jgi:hypothetical protein